MKKNTILLFILLLGGTFSYSFDIQKLPNVPALDNVIIPDSDGGYSIVSYPGGSTTFIVEMIAPCTVTNTRVKAIAHALSASFEIPIPNVGHLTTFPFLIGERIMLEITIYYAEFIPPIVFDLDLIVYDQTSSALGGGRFIVDLLDLRDF